MYNHQVLQELFRLDDFTINDYSFSKIELFKQCKFRYKLKYIEKRLNNDQRESFYLNIGRFSHNVLREYYNPKNIIKPDLQILFEKYWINKGFIDKNDEEYWYTKVKGRISNFIDQDNQISNVISVEEKFEERLMNWSISTIIDRINIIDKNYCEVIEYKFGDSNSMGIDIFKNFQWLFHYYAGNSKVSEIYNREIAYIKYCYLDSENFFYVYPTHSIVTQCVEKLKEAIVMIEEEKLFEPTVNKFCSDCRFDQICPLIKT